MKIEQLKITRAGFCDIIIENNYKIGVEIGVANEDYSKYLLGNSNLDKLYSIDPFIPEGEGYYCNQDVAKKTLEVFGNRSIIIPKKSEIAVSQFVNNYIDFIYIDGDHRKSEVEKDLKMWYSKLKSGGFFSGHDYHIKSQKGVVEAVNEFCISNNIEILYITELSNLLENVAGKEGGAKSWFFYKK